MKLSLLTYNCARDWPLEQIIEVAHRWGYAAIEFRAESNHKHGVELELDTAARQKVRRQLEDSYLPASCIGTSSRFEAADPAERQKQIDRTKRYVELARDIDCASSYEVEINLEMHGQFNFWRYALGAVEKAALPNVGIVYNCDRRDEIAGSVQETYSYVRDYINHVHMHDFTNGFPYGPVLRMLRDDGYEGYCSSEIDRAGPAPERVLAYYALLFREYILE